MIADLITYGHDIDRLYDELAYLVRHGCIVTEHQDKDQVAVDDLIAISPSGWVHVELLENSDYLAACAEDLWFGDEFRARKVAERIGFRGEYGHYQRSTITANARELVDYLKEQRDSWYRFPNKFLSRFFDEYLHSLDPLIRAVEKSDVQPDPSASAPSFAGALKVGDEVKGKVISVKEFGVFVRVTQDVDGLVHVSQLPKEANGATKVPTVGDTVTVRIFGIDNVQKKIKLDWVASG